VNKRIRNLIIGGIVLILLVGVLLVLKFMPQASTETEESSTVSYTSTSVELFTREESELTDIQLENEAGTLNLHCEQPATEEEDPVYTVEGLDGIDMNTKASTAFGDFDSVYANQLVEESPADLAKYGLDQPRSTITVTYTDGTSNILYLGDTLPTGTGCYGMVNDDPAVYAMSSTTAPYADLVLTDFVDTTVVETWVAPETTESEAAQTEPELRSMSIVGGSLTETLGDTPFTFVLGEYNEEMASYGMGGSNWQITSPVNASLHTENTTTIREAINAVTATSVAAIHPDEEAIATYGLAEPYAVVDFNRDGEDFHLVVGNSDGNGGRYVMTDGKDVVFVVAEDSLPWISIDLTKMFSSLIFLPYIDDVSQIDLMVDGQTYTFKMELSEPEEPAEGEEAEEPTLERVLYEDQEIDVDNFRKMYQYLISAPAEEINHDAQTGEHIASITYHYHDDPNYTDTVDFYQISERQMALGLNGDIDFTSRIAYITRLRQNIEKLLNGETPDLDY
jgi:hypothetical protein